MAKSNNKRNDSSKICFYCGKTLYPGHLPCNAERNFWRQREEDRIREMAREHVREMARNPLRFGSIRLPENNEEE